MARVRRIGRTEAIGQDVLFETRDAECGRTPDDTAIRRCLARNDLQQARFPRSIAADERDALARLDPEVSPLEEWDMSKGQRDGVEGQEGQSGSQQPAREHGPHRLCEPAAIVPRDFAAPEFSAHDLTRRRHVTRLERLFVFRSIAAERLLRGPGRVHECNVDRSSGRVARGAGRRVERKSRAPASRTSVADKCATVHNFTAKRAEQCYP